MMIRNLWALSVIGVDEDIVEWWYLVGSLWTLSVDPRNKGAMVEAGVITRWFGRFVMPLRLDTNTRMWCPYGRER